MRRARPGPSAHPVALVHDYLLVRRGAERTFEAIAECFPEAPIYTLLYDPEGTEGRFEGREVRTSFLQHLPIDQSNFRRLLPLFHRAIASLPLDQHQLTVSSSSAFAHAARGRVHVDYCHTPFRYAWFETERALAEVPAGLRPALAAALRRARRRRPGHRLSRQLGADPGADRPLLGARLDRRPPAGRGRALRRAGSGRAGRGAELPDGR